MDKKSEPIFVDIDSCYNEIAKNRSGILLEEFKTLCKSLFCNSDGFAYEVPEHQIVQMFKIFDQNQDEFIDRKEFQYCWDNWITIILRPVSALLIVDVQNDFVTGSLSLKRCSAKQDGKEVFKPINKLLENTNFELVAYTLDWHPCNHISFIENVGKRRLHSSSPLKAVDARTFDTVIFDGPSPISQLLWPAHCIQNTWGSQLCDELKIVNNSIKVYKGTNSDIDSYSAFADNDNSSNTALDAQLKANGITDVYVCGLAYDICVAATALHAISHGYRTIIIDDCSRGTDFEKILIAKEKIISKHGIVTNSNKVKAMINGYDRCPILAFKLALQLRRETT